MYVTPLLHFQMLETSGTSTNDWILGASLSTAPFSLTFTGPKGITVGSGFKCPQYTSAVSWGSNFVVSIWFNLHMNYQPSLAANTDYRHKIISRAGGSNVFSISLVYRSKLTFIYLKTDYSLYQCKLTRTHLTETAYFTIRIQEGIV